MSGEVRILRDDPFVKWGDGQLRFRLTYQGLLLSEANNGGLLRARASHKHSIRKHFHHQLKRLWDITPYLMKSAIPAHHDGNYFGQLSRQNSIEGLAERFDFFGYRFVPLLTGDLGAICSIDVLYLRNDPPGSIFSQGDIDNRLKTLFDALKMPTDKNQLGEYETPDADEDPFFCLLEDDSLITRASVETDTLLSPVSKNADMNDARVIVTVETKLLEVRHDNIGFG